MSSYSKTRKEDALKKVKLWDSSYLKLPDDLRVDPDVALEACMSFNKTFLSIPVNFRKDKKFVLDFLKSIATATDPFISNNSQPPESGLDTNIIAVIPTDVLNDREILLEAVRVCPAVLRTLPESIKITTELAKQFIKDCPSHFNFLPEKLRSNAEICLEALKNDSVYVYYALNLLDESHIICRKLYQKSILRYFEVRDTQKIRDKVQKGKFWDDASEEIVSLDTGDKAFYKDQADALFSKVPVFPQVSTKEAFQHILDRMDVKDYGNIRDSKLFPSLTEMLNRQKLLSIKRDSIFHNKPLARKIARP